MFNSIYNPIDENGAWFGNNVPRWINHIHKVLRATSPDDVKLLYLEGTSEPLSIFSTLVPYFTNQNGRHVQTDDLGQTYDVLVRVPNSNFSVLDVENSSSEYVKTIRTKMVKHTSQKKVFTKIKTLISLKNLVR